jgi:hypothetical protein
MASGYIAGGAIAGIMIAFLAGVLIDTNLKIEHLANTSNPFFGGPYANLLSLLPFAVLVVLLYLTGRERVLSGRAKS